MSKKLSAEQKEAKEFDGSADLGSVITRTVKKPAAKKAPAKKAEAAAPVESEQALEECGVVVFTSEFIENLVLLFGFPVAMCFCKCAIVWAYSGVNDEMVRFLASKYVELRNRNEALRKAEEEE